VFVVDDEPLIGEVVEVFLDKEGFEVSRFSDPEIAWRAFSEASPPPVLLVTDYVMRPFNGMELIQKCRGVHPGLLTLLYSGNVSAHITDHYPEKPHAFLGKPFHPKVLAETVMRLLAEHPPGKS